MEYRSNTSLAEHNTDLQEARRFHHGALGFEIIHEDEDKLLFSTGSLTLDVNRDHRLMRFIPSPEVRDLEEARDRLQASGGEIVRDWFPSAAIQFVEHFAIVWDVKEVEGVLRQSIYRWDKFEDAAIYSILHEEYETAEGAG